MTDETMPVRNPHLAGENARRVDIDQPWEQGNQEWWDWYVTLAENDEDDAGTLQAAPPLPEARSPTREALDRELSEPYDLTQDQIDFFRREGFIKLKHVFSSNALLHLRKELVRLLSDSVDAELDGGVRDRFLSLDMVWLENDLVRKFVLSARIGKLAADLLGVASVRLYHDNVLSKEPGCGRTPWHYDDHHFPLATNDVVTVWIPTQPIPREMGPLAFAESIETYRLVETVPFTKFDTSYDRRVSDVFRKAGVVVDDGPFDLGDVSFHHNLNFHTAGPNHTSQSRIVLSNTFFADGARLVDQATMVSGDWKKFAPGVPPGGRLATPVNPVCWPPEKSRIS
ncbi:MAG: phytanoyl-CoA dioxygenase family protein [Alphaproteobacteria bacterium]|nr:phytanoyl-CoA dioxygenase family protein [Alphaproteobacteria bacterium]